MYVTDAERALFAGFNATFDQQNTLLNYKIDRQTNSLSLSEREKVREREREIKEKKDKVQRKTRVTAQHALQLSNKEKGKVHTLQQYTRSLNTTFINYNVKLFIEDALCNWGNEPFELNSTVVAMPQPQKPLFDSQSSFPLSTYWVGPLEGRYALKVGTLKKFSEQEALECVYKREEKNGCRGGQYFHQWDWYKRFRPPTRYGETTVGPQFSDILGGKGCGH
eukprot:sb/3469757/